MTTLAGLPRVVLGPALVSRLAARSALGVLLLGPLLGGCFDVKQVDVATEVKPPPRLIDDFNDDVDNGDRQPTDASLEPWRCFGRNGPVQIVRCDPAQGINGTQGRALTFQLFDMPDGKRDYRGAELQTRALVPVDFTPYERFVFWATLEPGATASSTPVRIALYCGDPANEAVLESQQPLQSGAPFRAILIEMAGFHQPDWQKQAWQEQQQPPLDELGCLGQVHAVGIVVEPGLPDGQEAAGTLRVDEIYAQ